MGDPLCPGIHLQKDEAVSALALIDFDGTVCRKDSYQLFLKYSFPLGSRLGRMVPLAPAYLGYRLGSVSAGTWKTRLWSTFFSGWEVHTFAQYVDRFLPTLELNYLRPEMLARLKWHLREGHEVAIVTANFEPLLKPWADSWNARLLASQPEVHDGRFTGKLIGKPCTGLEKANRVKQAYPIQGYTKIFAYGNSPEDRAMMSLATDPFYQTFNFGSPK